MQEARIDHADLEQLVEKLAKAPQVLAEAKRQAFQAAAPKLKSAVDAQIGGSGRVRSWQGTYVGSKGGYAAVRPKKKTYIETKGKQRGFRAGPKKYAVGYVTNAVNYGHRTPRDAWGFRRQAGTVSGREFYQSAQAQAETVGQETAQQIVDAVISHLEG